MIIIFIIGEITVTFEEQRIKLNERKNSLKSELDLKVIEIKERLENYYHIEQSSFQIFLLINGIFPNLRS